MSWVLLPLIIQYFSCLRWFFAASPSQILLPGATAAGLHWELNTCHHNYDWHGDDRVFRSICQQFSLLLCPRVTHLVFVFSHPPSLPPDWSASSRRAAGPLLRVRMHSRRIFPATVISVDLLNGNVSCQCAPVEIAAGVNCTASKWGESCYHQPKE